MAISAKDVMEFRRRTGLGMMECKQALEEAGGDMTEVWNVDGAKGSKVWPEHLGGRAHDFRVELEGPAGGKRIAALEIGRAHV